MPGRRRLIALALALGACNAIVGFPDFQRVQTVGPSGGADGGQGEVAVGAKHSCAVMADRTLTCWGLNDFGQLGIGSTENKAVPTPVPGVKDVTFLSLGTKHTCATSVDGTVRCWGSNESSQLGIGAADTKAHDTPQLVACSPAKKVQASKGHTCIETLTKTVECWGANQHGQLGDGTTDQKSSATRVPGIAGVEKLSSNNGDFTCAVARNADAGGDAVFCWGLNDKGQLGQPLSVRSSPVPLAVSGVTEPDKVFIGRESACATLPDTTVVCWGANEHGQLGDGTFATRPTPAAVSGVIAMTEISPAFGHTCGNEGAVGIAKCWGSNEFGQLGIGQVGGDKPTPQALPGNGWQYITSDGEHTCGRRGGVSYCWGRNDSGQLGNGTMKDTATPTPVKF